jgi:NTE family protein
VSSFLFDTLDFPHWSTALSHSDLLPDFFCRILNGVMKIRIKESTVLRRNLLAIIALALISGVCWAQEGTTGTRPKVAVVLSGGSAFGIAHVGVLKEIEAAGIPIDMIVGTSMGSIVGGLYASGYSPTTMANIITTLDWNSVFMDSKASSGDRFERLARRNFGLRIGLDSKGLNIGAGLLEGQNILTFFTTLTAHALEQRDFDKLPVQYRAVAADILTGDKVVIGDGSIAEAMRSSMSIPVLFMPYSCKGKLLVDGGVVDNLPVDVAKKLGADIIIAVVSRAKEPDSIDSLNSAMEIAGQTGNLFLLQNMRPNIKDATLVITPNLEGFSTASYTRAKELIQRGVDAGKAAMPQLIALADEIAKSRPLVTPDSEPNRLEMGAPPVLRSVRVEGAIGNDEELVKQIFAPLLGKSYSRNDLGNAISSIYQMGRYDLVKFDLQAPGIDGDAGGYVGILKLVPDTTPENAIFIGLDYQGAYSNSISSNMVVQAGYLMRGFTGPNSALFFSAAFVNKARASLEYFQPFGPFFLEPWARFSFEYDVFASESIPVTVGTKFRTAGLGSWAGVTLGKDADIMLGYSFENVLTGDDWTKLGAVNAGALRGAIRFDTRETSIFPHRGVDFTAFGRWFDPMFGGELSFAQAELEASAAIPMGEDDTLGISAFGGTDFSGIVSGANPAKVSYYSSLKHPGMFYGIGYSSYDSVGNSVVAGALEYRHRIGLANSIVGGDIVALLNGSVGSIVQYDEPTTYSMVPLRYSVSLGIGAKIARHFGVMAAMSLLGNLDSTQPLTVALAVEMGSFTGGRVEDKR